MIWGLAGRAKVLNYTSGRGMQMKKSSFAVLFMAAITLIGCTTITEPYSQSRAEMTTPGALSIAERQSWKDINPRAH